VRAGDWKIAFGVQYFLGQDIHHATLGIIGMGRIGQAIARRALASTCASSTTTARGFRGDEQRLNADVVERDELLAQSDFVVGDGRLTRRQLTTSIGAAEIAKMKPTAVLVNSALGGVVDDARAGGGAQGESASPRPGSTSSRASRS
jgi:lactate dehydrogenase-like 2-hydroxyacid dehydrogenase